MRRILREYGFTIAGIAIGVAGIVALGAMGERIVRLDRKSTRLNSSHIQKSRMPSSA